MEYLKNGCATVNCGKIQEMDGLEIEILSPSISGHTSNIVTTYFMEDGKKVEVTYYRTNENEGTELYFFNKKEGIQHYYSRNYKWMKSLPDKYVSLVNELMIRHKAVFSW